MVTHVAQGFLDYIKAELRKIGDTRYIPSGLTEWAYPHRVTAYVGERTAKKDPKLPDVYISPRDTIQERDSTENSGAIFAATMEVMLDFAIRSRDPVTDLMQLTHDVLYVFGNDPRLGGTCLNTEIVGIQTVIMEDELPLCGIDVTVLVQYRYDMRDPSTLR